MGYQREGTYNVSINCTGATNYLYLEFKHYVQSEVYGLKQISPGTVANRAYAIQFEVLAGSEITQYDLYVDGVLDNGTTFDQKTLKGSGTYYPQGKPTPGIYTTRIVMANIVSRVSQFFCYLILISA